MKADDVAQIDAAWERERERYVGGWLEPNPPQRTLVFLIVSALLFIFVLVGIPFTQTAPDRVWMLFALAAVVGSLVLGLFLELLCSLQYERARVDYLRRRMAVRAAGQGRAEPVAFPPFSALAVFTLAPDRLYRVYCDGTHLHFIERNRQFSERAMTDAEVAALDRTPPHQLAEDARCRLTIRLDDVVSAVLEPPSVWGGHGRHAARWLLRVADGKQHTFQIADTDELDLATVVLASALGNLTSMVSLG
jgi:hypothetical protein